MNINLYIIDSLNKFINNFNTHKPCIHENLMLKYIFSDIVNTIIFSKIFIEIYIENDILFQNSDKYYILLDKDTLMIIIQLYNLLVSILNS